MIDTSIFKAYDIRGIYPTQINEECMEDIIRGIYTFLSKSIKRRDISIVIGHDMRLSSPSLHKIAVEVLQKSGAQVIDIGLAATPSVYFTIKKYSYDAAIQISASHNPKEYNGIKIVRRDGDALTKIGKQTGMDEIVKNVTSNSFAEFVDGGSYKKLENILELELDEAITAIPTGNIDKLNVVVDPANAMGILPVKELFGRFNANLIEINFELDGTFPVHQADPLQHSTLVGLQKTVLDQKADLGIAIDGDADRAMFIDEKGEIIPATLITTLIASEILKENPGARILVDIRYIRNVEEMVTKLGGVVGYTNIGHALITKQVNDEGAIFAGESSGHYYFQSMGGCESTVRVILYVLRVLARENKPMSEIMKLIQKSIESGEYNFKLKSASDKETIVNKLKELYKDGELNELDGIAISYPSWRFSVRSSNTEPLLRLNVEGDTQDIVDDKTHKIQEVILGFGAILHS